MREFVAENCRAQSRMAFLHNPPLSAIPQSDAHHIGGIAPGFHNVRLQSLHRNELLSWFQHIIEGNRHDRVLGRLAIQWE